MAPGFEDITAPHDKNRHELVMKARFALWLLCFGTLFLSVDARGRGRGRRGSRSFGHRKRQEEMPEPAMPVVEYKYSTRLDADEYVEQVERAANGSQKQLYFPFVLYHVSWCQHCKHTLPEFEKGAEMLNKAGEEGKLRGLERPVKFFLIECDKSPENRQQCQKQAGTAFPVLKLFRDNRALQYTGHRFGKTMADWTAHMSRPTVLQVESKSEMDRYAEHATLFLIKAEVATHPDLFKTWVELSYEYLEEYYFAVVPMESEVAKMMPAAPSVTVRGKNMDPLPLPRRLSVRSMKEWIFVNRWPIVVEMTPEVAVKLMQSKRDVVVFAYKFRRGVKLEEKDETFRAKALELRREADLIFAGLDCSVRENSEFLAHFFPVVSPPSIFVFSGNASLKSDIMYWEDPWLTSEDLSLKSIKDLQNNTWNKQDTSNTHWVKGWSKRGFRFGTGSVVGVIVMIVLPIALCGLCCLCVREFMMPDDEEKPQPTSQLAPNKAQTPQADAKLRSLDGRTPQPSNLAGNLGHYNPKERRAQLVRAMEAAAARGDYIAAGRVQEELQRLSRQSNGFGQDTGAASSSATARRPSPAVSLPANNLPAPSTKETPIAPPHETEVMTTAPETEVMTTAPETEVMTTAPEPEVMTTAPEEEVMTTDARTQPEDDNLRQRR